MALVAARINIAVDAALADADFVQLHTGAPGGAGTANVAAQVTGRQSLSWSAAAGGISTAVATFTVNGAEGPYTHVSYWSAGSGGTFQGTAALTPQETFAGPGSLQVTSTTTGTST